MEGQTITRQTWLCIALVVAAGLALRTLAFAPYDISHADELMQYLEQGKRLATGHGIVPWEYRYGARNELLPQLLALPYWLGAKFAPGTLAGMLAARWTFLALTLLALPAARRLGALTSRTHALAALLVAAVWYENVLFSTPLLSEVLATALIAMAAALLLSAAPSRAALRWAGLLLGLGVIVRLQYAPFVAVLALARLRTDWRAGRELALGGLAAQSGGARSLRGGAPIPLAAHAAVARKATCGIALPDQWRAHLVPALLPRAVPLYVAPAATTARADPLPAGLVRAADVLIFPHLPNRAPGYRELTCRTNAVLKACVYVRPGGCLNDPNWTYQAALGREDL